jgi:hypothetical protein
VPLEPEGRGLIVGEDVDRGGDGPEHDLVAGLDRGALDGLAADLGAVGGAEIVDRDGGVFAFAGEAGVAPREAVVGDDHVGGGRAAHDDPGAGIERHDLDAVAVIDKQHDAPLRRSRGREHLDDMAREGDGARAAFPRRIVHRGYRSKRL